MSRQIIAMSDFGKALMTLGCQRDGFEKTCVRNEVSDVVIGKFVAAGLGVGDACDF